MTRTSELLADLREQRRRLDDAINALEVLELGSQPTSPRGGIARRVPRSLDGPQRGPTPRDYRTPIMDFLSVNGPSRIGLIYRAIGVSSRTTFEVLAGLCKEGLVVSTGTTRTHRRYELSQLSRLSVPTAEERSEPDGTANASY